MVRNPVVARPETSVVEIARLMRNKSISSVILVEGKKPVGIITERDLVHRVIAEGKNPKSWLATDICSKPVIAVQELLDIDGAVELMNDYKIRRLVVVDSGDNVVGIITTDDIGSNLREVSEELAVKYLNILDRRK
jgi:CBS domain-containing protein